MCSKPVWNYCVYAAAGGFMAVFALGIVVLANTTRNHDFVFVDTGSIREWLGALSGWAAAIGAISAAWFTIRQMRKDSTLAKITDINTSINYFYKIRRNISGTIINSAFHKSTNLTQDDITSFKANIEKNIDYVNSIVNNIEIIDITTKQYIDKVIVHGEICARMNFHFVGGTNQDFIYEIPKNRRNDIAYYFNLAKDTMNSIDQQISILEKRKDFACS
ncbi:hypothetical protein [Polycladidibacter hongkongensis]|uniref:hypothetical protein n=1 Tax=Polycladidibacter hongkongensis TaxID=1647556 RepID=UPI000ADE9E94|nr:hypothetical protein [Pseudovibrio hongkongensis]